MEVKRICQWCGKPFIAQKNYLLLQPAMLETRLQTPILFQKVCLKQDNKKGYRFVNLISTKTKKVYFMDFTKEHVPVEPALLAAPQHS